MSVMRLDRVRACNIYPPFGGQSVKRLLTKYLIRRHKLAESPQPPRIRLLSLREKRSGSGNATSIPPRVAYASKAVRDGVLPTTEFKLILCR